MSKGRNDYARKLLDPRWQKKRTEVLTRADWTCGWCGGRDKPFHVHHGFYEAGREPWEYEDSELQALCEDCHEHVEKQRRALIRHLVRAMPSISIMQLIGYVKGLEAQAKDDGDFQIDDIEEAGGFGDSLLVEDMEVIYASELSPEERRAWYRHAREREIQTRNDWRWARRQRQAGGEK